MRYQSEHFFVHLKLTTSLASSVTSRVGKDRLFGSQSSRARVVKIKLLPKENHEHLLAEMLRDNYVSGE
jgi:hypothetical protein